MPKPDLKPEYSQLEHDMIETMLAGHKEWRPDLDYPQGYSDLQACARALMRMFNIERRPLALESADIVKERDKCSWCAKELKFQVYQGHTQAMFCEDCGKKLREEE